jgi:hypothetical protein
MKKRAKERKKEQKKIETRSLLFYVGIIIINIKYYTRLNMLLFTYVKYFVLIPILEIEFSAHNNKKK